MTVYYYDLFTGTAGTLLTSHTADSGATWPNDANHLYEYNSLQLDGNGAVFLEGTQPTLAIPSATQPSSQNFEVLFTFKRLSALSGSSSGVELLRQAPFTGSAEDYAFIYNEGSGFTFLHSGTPVGNYAAGPTVGTLWYLKVDVSTSGANTSFASYYSTTSGGKWIALTNYSVATPSDAVAAGLRFVGTSATTTTGHHIGDLTVQDIPALSSATLSGPTQQLFSIPAELTVELNGSAGTDGVVVTLPSSNGSDTFQATHGGANLSPSQITIPQGEMSGTFWLTPGGSTGDPTIMISASGSKTSSPTYDSLPAATAFTITGATGGHQNVAATWTINLVGGYFTGTVTATPGGGVQSCGILTPIVTTFNGTQTSLTFSFTPLNVDSVTFTFSSSPSLSTTTPTVTFTSTGIFYEDTFVGTSGSSLASHTSNTLPGLSGSTYTLTGSGTIELDGTGMCFLASGGSTFGTNHATMPAWSTSGGGVFEVVFSIKQMTNVGSYGGVCLMFDGTNSLVFEMGSSNSGMFFSLNGGSPINSETANLPALNTLWYIKIDITNPGNPQYPTINLYYSTDGLSWNNLTGSNPQSYFLYLPNLPSAIAVGPYFSGATGTPTTGVHVGNIAVQDISLPSPNCTVSQAYVCSSGQEAMFFFEQGSTQIIPTAINYAPAFFRNGTSLGLGVNPWVTGYHWCIGFALPPGTQILNTDVVTVEVPNSWVSCGTGNAVAGYTSSAPLTLTNNTGQSCFGTAEFTKSLKMGLNFTLNQPMDSCFFNLMKNWRWRASIGFYTSAPDYVGYSFLNSNQNNGIDATTYPGLPGYWAIGFDDPNYSTLPMTVSIVTGDSAQCTVTQVHGNDTNPALTGGANQYYLFQVTPTLTSTVNTPLVLQIWNGQPNPSINSLNNVQIVGPGDFNVPASGNTAWSFDRSNQYALSNNITTRLSSGLGCARWMDSCCGFATQPWHATPFNAVSWSGSLLPSYTITFTQARALIPPGTSGSTSYIYSDFLGSINYAGTATWTCSSGLSAAITSTTQTTITIGSASTDPIFCGVLIKIDSEQMMVMSLTGTSTLTVWRAACGTTAATHANGAAVTILSKRWAWTSLSQLACSVPICFELVCAANHGMHEWTPLVMNMPSGWPTLTLTDGTTFVPNSPPGPIGGPYVTGPNTLAWSYGRFSGSGAVTLSAPSGTVSLSTTFSPSLGVGYPLEMTAIATGSFPGANLWVNIPIMASDAYAWDAAAKVKNYFPAGRRVYLELDDEPWNNTGPDAFNVANELSYMAGIPNLYYYIVTRTSQIRTIFRTVFGSRANEIHALTNQQWGGIATWETPTSGNLGSLSSLGIAAYYGLTIECIAVAPYTTLDTSTPTINAWNGSSTIQQLIDLASHDWRYNNGANAFFPAMSATTGYNQAIAGYNAQSCSPNFNGTTGTCFLVGYEGLGSQTPNPIDMYGNVTYLAVDCAMDPLWYFMEQVEYQMLQMAGFQDFNIYSYDIYLYYNDQWGVYLGLAQSRGRGDGSVASDGKAYTNRNYFTTPQFRINYAGTPATSFITNTTSVRGQAFADWMQPAQGKRRMLFVPYRFVNR